MIDESHNETSDAEVEKTSDAPVPFLKKRSEFNERDHRWIRHTLIKIENGSVSEKVLRGQGLERPQGGDVIAYHKLNDRDQGYKSDGYHYWCRLGPAYVVKDTGLKRHRFRLQEPTKNKVQGKTFDIWKTVWSLENPKDKKCPAFLIQYTGKTGNYKPQPHGNSRKKTGFSRTNPQLTITLQTEAARKHSKPHAIFEDAQISASKTKDPSMDPRNIEQVYNAKRHVSNKLKLSPCEITSLLQMAKFDVGDFIQIVQIHPLEIVVLAEPSLLAFTKDMLIYSNSHPDLKQVLNYDTTFELGDFYVSMLVCKNVLVEGDKIFPVAVLIHEKKNVECHEIFWKFLNQKLDLNVLHDKVPICVDREKALQKAIRSVCKDANIILCENHILTDVKRFIMDCANKSIGDVSILCSDIRSLLASEEETTFKDLYEKYSVTWAREFKNYIDKSLFQDLWTSGRFNTKRFSAFSDCLATNNLSESMNFVLKHREGFKETRLDLFALHVLKWQCSYLRNFKAGENGKGDFVLKNEKTKLLPELPFYLNFTELEIVDKCREERGTEETNQNSKSYKFEIAETIQKNNLISFSSQQQCWIVRHPVQNDLSTVDIIRNEGDLNYKCSCKHPPVCVHVVAVCLATKQDVNETVKSVQLHSIVRNKRKYKAGRKFISKREAVDVIPAPDSIAAKSKRPCHRFENKQDSKTENENKKLVGENANDAQQNNVEPILLDRIRKGNDSIDDITSVLILKDMKKESLSCSSRNCNDDKTVLKPVASVLNQPNKHSIKKCNEYLKGSAKSLNGTQWLASNVMDAVIKLFIYRGFSHRVGYVCDAGFQSLCLERSDLSSFMLQYSSDYQLLNKDLVIVNCIINSNHWALGLIFFASREIYLLDPFHYQHSEENKPREQTFNTLVKIAEAALFVGGISQKVDEWQAIYCTDVPNQLDGTECGVIACILAFCILQNFSFPTNEDVMDTKRNRNWVLQNFIDYGELSDSEQQKLEHPKSIRLKREVRQNWKLFLPSIKPPSISSGLGVSKIMSQLHSVKTIRECYSTCAVTVSNGNYVFCVYCRLWFHGECVQTKDTKEIYFLCDDCKAKLSKGI